MSEEKEKEKNQTELTFGWKDGGLISLWRWKPTGAWILHILPDDDHRVWGKVDGWFDGPIKTYGLGPLFSFVWQPR